MLYLQKYLRIFKKILFAERSGRWVFWLKISSAQRFWVCNSNVRTFRKSRKCKNFNIFLYTVPAEMLYLHKYLTNFQKFSFRCNIRTWLLCLKISRAQVFWFCNGNVTTFPTSRKCKNFNSSQKIFLLKDDEGGYGGWKFQRLSYFGFAMATLQLFQHPKNV